MKRNDQRIMPASSAMTQDNAELGQVAFALFTDLQSSMQRSIQALLRRDLTSLDHATQEQKRMLLAMQAVFSASRASRTADTSIAPASPIRQAAVQVLSLGRVQAALLARAQRYLAVVSNRLAGPQRSYSLGGSRATSGIFLCGSPQKGESHCQD